MAREAPRTLRSLSNSYQGGVKECDYEVIVVDNGSPIPLEEEVVRGYGANFRYVNVQNASPSPAAAVNFGARLARGSILGVMVDGARIASPGLLSTAIHGIGRNENTVLATLGWHLGPVSQQRSIALGYNQLVEDEMLRSVNWPESHYRLFEISAFAQSSRDGLFAIPAESNGIFVSRALFDALGGFDEAFNVPGGGFVNHDFFRRAVERPGANLVVPLGEGTFHQIHGGISTNAAKRDLDGMVRTWGQQYRSIRGFDYEVPDVRALYLGPVHMEQERLIIHSVQFYRYGGIRRLADTCRAWLVIRAFLWKGRARAGVSGAARRILRVLPLSEPGRETLRKFCDRYLRWLYVPD